MSLDQVLLEKQRVFGVEGERLSLGDKDLTLEQAQPLRATAFLGKPFSSRPVPLENRYTTVTGLLSGWRFPGISIEVLSDDQGYVDCIIVREPRS